MLEEIIRSDTIGKIFTTDVEMQDDLDVGEKNVCVGKVSRVLSETQIEFRYSGEYVFSRNSRDNYALYLISGEKVYLTYASCVDYFSDNDEKIVEFEVVSSIERIQRRMHQRVSCHSLIGYKILKDEEIKDVLDGEKEIVFETEDYEDSLVDISGGGVRFTTKREVNPKEYIFISFDIKRNDESKKIKVCGQVVYSDKMRNEKDLYDVRIKYIGLPEKQREDIIRFVFQLERNPL